MRDVSIYDSEQSILIRVVDHVYQFRTHTVLSSFRFEISKYFLVNTVPIYIACRFEDLCDILRQCQRFVGIFSRA
jgi:hypothetical protein